RDLIAYEDLQVRNLVHNHHLAKSVGDADWARLLVWLVYYARLHRILVLAMPPRYTSQACSGCSTLVVKTLSTRTHACPRSGLVLDRDENAARNILALGLAMWQQHLHCTVGQTGAASP